MKRILLAVVLFIGVWGFAQNIEKIIKEQIVDKIKNYKPTDLVPYSKDGKKWALMDVKSRKILTDFILNEPSTFNSELNVNINVGERKEEMTIYANYDISPLLAVCYVSKRGVLDVKEMDGLGFQIDEQGRMTACNKDYKYISNPILYKGVYYAIVTYEKYERSYFGRVKALVNQKGKERKGFRFREMDDTYYKDKESGETILYVEDFDGRKGFLTISGKKKLYGELMNSIEPSAVLGYSVQKDGESTDEIKKSGVIDLTTQEWLIKPQEKYKIYDIIYTSSEKIKKYDETDRNKATVYFLATDQNGQRFVLDIKGNPILPKN
ncbi:MAG: hypothetical protein HG457_002020 [Flavobacteriaceae bacterium]|nr:hypothetical protein [Flavobacteriaceae bacterium]